MKRHKSGAQKRKEAAAAQESVKKLTKLTQFFPLAEQKLKQIVLLCQPSLSAIL